MPTLTVNGVTIAYDDIRPAGEPERTIVLLHGFASNREEGWRRTGWYGAFERRRIRTIALDQRGHGESEKFYDPSDYLREKLAGDVLGLMDQLGVGRADLFGYSMGTRIALEAALDAPDCFSNLILGGVGGTFFEPRDERDGASMVEAMVADDPETIFDPMRRSFRQFADEQGEDRKALAAFTQVPNTPLGRERLASLPMSVLVLAGQRDHLAGDPEELAQAFPHGRGVSVVGCDHFSAIPHALTKATVFDFLDGILGLDDEFPPFE